MSEKSDPLILFALLNHPFTRHHSTQFVPINLECHRRSDPGRVSLPAAHTAPIY